MIRFLFRRFTALSIAISFMLTAGAVNAETISASEAGKKTMSKFMVNLAKFVSWPDSKFAGEAAPYKYCLMGDDPFHGILSAQVTDKQAKNRSFDITNIPLGDIESAKSCHVVFLNVPSADQATAIIDGLAGMPILTVAEVDQFAQYGGMVGFIGEGRKVALAVNQKLLEDAGLKASSRLYRASTM
jgi:hypothetical protein